MICCDFVARMSKIAFWGIGWVLAVKSKRFRDIREISWFRKILSYSSVRETNFTFQKQQPRGVLSKRCSENIKQIYRRTPTPMCHFNKVAKQQLYWNHTSAWVFSCIFTAYFRAPFPKNTSGWLLVTFIIWW